MRLGLVIFTIIWSYLAFKRWKLVHNIIDTPTSKVRSVAVGAAELVGQVRPGPEGTLSFNVGGDVSRLVEGAVAYKWVEEEHVCRGSGEDRTCSGKLVEKENASVPFILHDGTGGILVDPSSWEKMDYGSMLHRWGGENGVGQCMFSAQETLFIALEELKLVRMMKRRKASMVPFQMPN